MLAIVRVLRDIPDTFTASYATGARSGSAALLVAPVLEDVHARSLCARVDGSRDGGVLNHREAGLLDDSVHLGLVLRSATRGTSAAVVRRRLAAAAGSQSHKVRTTAGIAVASSRGREQAAVHERHVAVAEALVMAHKAGPGARYCGHVTMANVTTANATARSTLPRSTRIPSRRQSRSS